MSDVTIGTVSLSATSSLVFSVGEWKSRYFAKVRKFITTQRYQGPTKSGFSLNKSLLQELISALSSLEMTIPPQEEREFKTIEKGDTEYICIATLPAENADDLPLVDVREYVDTSSYQGPTKRGIRFRWNLLPEVSACLREQAKVMSENEKRQPSLFETETFETEKELEESAGRSGEKAVRELVGEDPKRFPDNFLDGSAEKGACMELPEERLYLEQDSGGLYLLKTSEGAFSKVRNPAEANFIIYAQLGGHRYVTLPKEMLQVFKTVKAYENYVRGLRSRLVSKILKRACQQSVADYEADKLLHELGMPKLER